jgi:hypothetical protein
MALPGLVVHACPLTPSIAVVLSTGDGPICLRLQIFVRGELGKAQSGTPNPQQFPFCVYMTTFRAFKPATYPF